jgi:3-oxoacyl-[acyl-carrier-protein] synthase II
MNKRVVITGLGVVSSLGIGWQDFWQNLLKGTSGISPVTSFDTSNQFTHNGGEVKNFRPEVHFSDHEIRSMNRATQMALVAARMAVQDAGVPAGILKKEMTGISFGTNLGAVQAVEDIDELMVRRNATPDQELLSQAATHAMSSQIATEFNIPGGAMMFSTACSAGNYAIGYGFDQIRLGRFELVVTGASDAFSKVGFTGFNQFKAVAPEKCQPFDGQRKGMMVAEGAGCLIMESLDHALERKADVYAEILGYGLSCDAFHMTSSSVEGIARCMKKALRESGISRDEVEYISAHGTGTPTNDRNECAALREVFGERSARIPVSSIKSMLGHTMGAASALEAIVCALVVRDDIIPPTINYETPDPDCNIDCVPNVARKRAVRIAMNNSYAFGGNNACLIVKKYGH